ncbi:MAG: DinB family protein [Lacipirellulaceae bacterium]
MDRSKIELYAQGAPALRAAIAGLTAAERLAHPVPGTWSIQQIVNHTVESDLIATDRMRRIAAMERPLLVGYDETACAELPSVAAYDPDALCTLFEVNRALTATMLRSLPDEAFERFGIHTESGKVTLAEMIDRYAEHLAHHLRFIDQKRGLLGKPR